MPMILRHFYDPFLAQGSYLIGCQQTGAAIVIDPNRDIATYTAAAERDGLRIAYVTETHIHADFVSGARDLARATGATLLLSAEGGPDWQYGFATKDGARLIRDGDTIDVGAVRLVVCHTPGHTPEHLCFMVVDRATTDAPVGMLTGDFIFVGDVGRPDLLERAANVRGTMDTLARALYRSLEGTRELPDHLLLWPGHGAGSACGKALGAMPSTTLGYERLANWAFACETEEDFVAQVLAGQPEPPRYFARMKAVNRDGPPPAPARAIPDVSLAALQRALAAGTPVIDARSTAAYAAGHIPGTLNIPVGTSFATWAGSLLPYDRDLIVLADDDARVNQAVRLLAAIGLDHVAGRGGAAVREAWQAHVGTLGTVTCLTPHDLAPDGERLVMDVRGTADWRAGHLPFARHFFLGDLESRVADLPRDTPIAVACEGGTRSAIAASLLQARGFTDVANVTGGMRACKAAGLPVETESA
ncbi:MAG TPA: MBL fold metallo-hydrolase [Gemmatimonadaceae bacterium]|nr:MBL fold metallo-hydrolase [Gemmatimonadaceae bacterium]